MQNTPVLNNGLFVRESSYKVGSHIDSAHLMNLIKQEKPTDLGVIDIWAMSQKVEMPLYQMSSFKGKNVIEVDDPQGRFTWKVPVAQDLPYIVEDVSGLDKPGLDGTTFRIRLSGVDGSRPFGPTAVFRFSKYSGPELYVVPEDIARIEPSGAGESWTYTVQLVNNDNYRYLDKKYLVPGTKVFRVTSAKGEFGRSYDDTSVAGSSYREYYNYVGNAEATSTYSISSRAVLYAKSNVASDGGLKVLEVWRNLDNSLDPTITTLDGIANKMGDKYVREAIKNQSLIRGWIPAMEAAHISKIAKDIENYLMWGEGGTINAGMDKVRMSKGLWQQLDNSYRRIYSKKEFNLEMFRTELFNFFNGKENFVGPDPKRDIVVQTGMGGMKLINAAIAKEAVGSGLILNAKELGAVTNTGMDLQYGFSFTGFTIPFIANVKFVLNPAFDNVHDNDIDNPIIDGFRLSSYSYIIFDVTQMADDNIILLKNKHLDQGLIWFIKQGDMSYMGRELKGFQGDPNISGYSVYMRQFQPSIFVKDPTKIMKIVMRNPITGLAFGTSA